MALRAHKKRPEGRGLFNTLIPALNPPRSFGLASITSFGRRHALIALRLGFIQNGNVAVQHKWVYPTAVAQDESSVARDERHQYSAAGALTNLRMGGTTI